MLLSTFKNFQDLLYFESRKVMNIAINFEIFYALTYILPNCIYAISGLSIPLFMALCHISPNESSQKAAF